MTDNERPVVGDQTAPSVISLLIFIVLCAATLTCCGLLAWFVLQLRGPQ